LLAVLKAGGAYLPLDPSYPTERLMSMLRDAQAPVLLAAECMSANLSGHHGHVILLDPEGRLPANPAMVPAFTNANADDLAYVNYTSGSTGQPKGVEITQRSLVNLVSWHQRQFELTQADRAMVQASPGFDAAVLVTPVDVYVVVPDELNTAGGPVFSA